VNFPNQGYGQQPQQGWGQQQAPQAPAPITQSADDWWASQQQGQGVPSFKFENPGDQVAGEVLDMQAHQKTKIGTNEPMFDKNGKPLMQLVVTLQTQLQGWAGVAPDKVPTDAETNQQLQDDGKRRIYLWYTLRDAVMEALAKTGGKPLAVGDSLAVQVTGSKPNPMGGNPIKLYAAMHKPGNPAANAAAQQFAPPPAQQQAPPPQQQFQPPTQGQYVNPPQQTFTQNAPQQGFPAPQPSNDPPFG
jgi:hypothetical protein